VIWSLADRLGTVRDLVQYNTTTSTTTLVNHIQYDTFGQLTSQTDPTKTPWFGYTGREWDTATGLTYYRARWYDPRAGRFISEDPLSFAAGDVNLNRYVGNGATLWVDPSGMDAAPSQPTKNTYRKKFIQLTPAIDQLKTPFEIHHTLQQDKIIAARFLKERGINVHIDQHLRGVDIKLHDVIDAQQIRFWEEQREIMRKKFPDEDITIPRTKELIDLDLVTRHSQALTAEFDDCLIKSGATQHQIQKALHNTRKLMNDAESLAKKLSKFHENMPWKKLMNAAQLLVLAHALASSGQAMANPTPEQQQYRDHFYARFELSLNFAFDNHYLTGEHIAHLRDAMRNYTRSLGVSDKIQASLDLKLSLVEVQSPH
jgi:RHS repeat-associated protein